MRLVKRFTGKSKVAEELSYMADILNALLKMSVEGGEFAIKPGVGAILSLTKDDIIRIVKMTSDLDASDDGLLERTEGTAKLLQPGKNTEDNQDILEVIEGGEIDVHNRFGFSVSDGDVTLLIRDLRTGEWWPVGGGGSSQLTVGFRIVESFCGVCYATAAITMYPPGLSSVPGQDPYTGLIEVYDFSDDNCFLSGYGPHLVNARGHAVYGRNEHIPGHCAPDPDALGDGNRWEIIDLCCLNWYECV